MFSHEVAEVPMAMWTWWKIGLVVVVEQTGSDESCSWLAVYARVEVL